MKTKAVIVVESNDSDATNKQIIEPTYDANEITERLSHFITNKDLVGIQEIITEMKGVPGFAKLRKKAKLAAKNLS